jgi:hypothetical protein
MHTPNLLRPARRILVTVTVTVTVTAALGVSASGAGGTAAGPDQADVTSAAKEWKRTADTRP